jgi:oxygen-dependent protoporphyrinogen oxidase
MANVVVIGAGIAGLTAAYDLRAHDVTVIDGAPAVGGKLRTSSIAGLDVDEGAEQLLRRVPDAVGLVMELGLGDKLEHTATSSASVFSRGQLHPLPVRTVMGVPSSLGSLRGLLTPAEVARASADLVLPPRSVDKDASVSRHVSRRLGRAVVDRLVEPLLGGVYAGRVEELSMQATLPQLALVKGSLVRGARDVLPAPSDEPVFAAVVGGLQQVTTRLAERSGATFITGRLVRRLERTESGFRVVHGATNDEQVIDADAVVVAAPPPAATKLLSDVAPQASVELAAIEMASMAIVTLAWPRSGVSELTGSGYLVPAVEKRTVKAVTFTSSKWRHLAVNDVAVLRCSIGRHGDVAVLQRSDDELVDDAVRELQEVLGLTGAPVESRVTRWGGGLPQYTVGHLDRVRRIRAAVDAVPGLAVCGAAYDGVGVPACIRSGRAAAVVIQGRLANRDGG